ncbi:hypothetical protein SDC9_177089 [bioreactor metagenome]|uniref:Uncharacterized protein n=1 Tax=bioreactor metagenome TaxID=1076179 RepID=A0A645GTS5_9ZZZZ
MEIIPFFHGGHALGGVSQYLVNNGNGSPFLVNVADGQWDSFPFFIESDNQKLAGLGSLRCTLGFDIHPIDTIGQDFFT